MRHMIKGLVAAAAVMTAGAAPAMACGYGGCCGQVVSPCATSYAPAYTYAPAYNYTYSSGCGTCGNRWAYDRLAEPTTQYYYVNQGPTYSGAGAFAPYPAYREEAVPSYYGNGYGYGDHWRHHYRPWRQSYHYGYAPRHYGYVPRQYGYHYGHEGYYWGHRLVRRYY